MAQAFYSAVPGGTSTSYHMFPALASLQCRATFNRACGALGCDLKSVKADSQFTQLPIASYILGGSLRGAEVGSGVCPDCLCCISFSSCSNCSGVFGWPVCCCC